MMVVMVITTTTIDKKDQHETLTAEASIQGRCDNRDGWALASMNEYYAFIHTS